MRYVRLFIASILLSLAPLSASADEVWNTPAGQIIYEQDLGLVAVLTFPYNAVLPGEVPEFASERGTLYFPGLGGNFENRSIHDGYWMVPGSPACSAALTTADGQTSQRWGRARVIFDRPAFPTSMTVLIGRCLDDPTLILRGDRP